MGIYHPQTKLREGNIFSRVCLSASHPVQLPPRLGTWGPLASTSDIWWLSLRPVETCSLDLTAQPPTGTDICWPLTLIWLASRRYSSYWNAVLFGNGQNSSGPIPKSKYPKKNPKNGQEGNIKRSLKDQSLQEKG